MTNTTESLAPVHLPGNPHINASSAAYAEHARIKGVMIVNARPRTKVIPAVGPTMIVARRCWPAAPTTAVGARALELGQIDVYLDELGLPESVDLSTDGRAIDHHAFCRCDDVVFDEWVYVERWAPNGMLAHGWVHDACRRWTQTG